MAPATARARSAFSGSASQSFAFSSKSVKGYCSFFAFLESSYTPYNGLQMISSNQNKY
jgi:hypothetical protein